MDEWDSDKTPGPEKFSLEVWIALGTIEALWLWLLLRFIWWRS